MLTTHEWCRSCKATLQETPDFSLHPQHIATYFVGPGVEVPTTERFPLDLHQCPNCKLIQLRHTVDRELLFRHYWYRSSISNTMKCHLQELAFEASELTELKKGDTVIDIGANDGTFLSNITPSIRRVAIEPSQIADEIKEPIIVIRDFFPWKNPMMQAKLITAIAMFYDLEEPGLFLDAVHDALLPDGAFCVEVADWPRLMRLNAFDTICHEHLHYFSLESLLHLGWMSGLVPVKISRNELNGASLRVYFKRQDSPGPRCFPGITPVDTELMIERERENTPTWPKFAANVALICDETYQYLVKKLGPIALLGASTKGNVFLQAAGLHAGLITHAWERDPSKAGLWTLGTGIPIMAENPDWYDEVRLVMPWHFLPEIVAREQPYLEKGGEIIVALPSFRKITKENWGLATASFMKELEDAT